MDSPSCTTDCSVESGSEFSSVSGLSDCEGTQPYLFEPYDSHSDQDTSSESDAEQQNVNERLQNTDW